MDESGDVNMEEDSASHPIASEAEEDSDVDIEGLDVDMDAFLIQIESKLRTNFSALDLTKTIVSPNTHTLTIKSSSTSGVITPSQFIKVLSNCLHRMTKPIQLRCLMALLGLDPDVGQLHANGKDGRKANESFHKQVLTLLNKAQEKCNDQWVRVLASIVQGKLFLPTSLEGKEASGNHCGSMMDIRSRSKETDQMIRKACDGVIASIQQASEDAYELFKEKEDELAPDTDDEEGQAKAESILESMQLGVDAKPQFSPWCYRLGGKALVEKAIPELVEKVDFSVNEDADILHEDERVEQKKAEEERKELEQQEKMRILAEERKKKLMKSKAVGNGPGQQNRIRPGSNTTKKQTSKPDTASFLVRSKMNKSRVADAKIGSLHSGTRGRSVGLGRGRMAGLGRGAAANAIGGKNLATPMSRAALNARGGRSQSLLTSRHPGGISALGSKSAFKGRTATLALANGSRSVSRTKTKMKMIDTAEVEGLKKEEEERNMKLSEEEIRNNKKRKIREAAAAKGLTKKKWNTTETATATTIMDASIPDSKRIKFDPEYTAAVPVSNFDNTSHGTHQGSLLNGSVTSVPISFDKGMGTSNQHLETQRNESQESMFLMSHNNSLSSQHFGLNNSVDFEPNPVDLNQSANFVSIPLAAPPPPEQNWQQLLEKSNKLSLENRHRVELFFVDKVNPTPDIPIWKMKLHQEDTMDPNTAQLVKETLYLELDYTTFGFKKLRKVKQKK